MRKFFDFSWLKIRPKEWAISFSMVFGGFDAGRDRCQAPDCGVQRKLHGRAHKFVEVEKEVS